MNRYLQLLAVLAFALTGAVAWHLLSADPGYVLVTFRGWSIESTLVVAVLLAALAFGLLWLGVRLLRSPFRLWRRQRRQRARARLADGVLAMFEGHLHKAERLLHKAAREGSQQAAAALLAAQIAQTRNDDRRLDDALQAARDAGANVAADTLAARRLLDANRPGSASELLEGAAHERSLSPAALEVYARSLIACGRAADALPLLPGLAGGRGAAAPGARALLPEIARAALNQSRNLSELRGHWNALPRAQRQQAQVVLAFANRASQLDDAAVAADAIDALLQHHWSDDAALLYGQLAHADPRHAIRRAERWLASRPEQPATLIALGELCRREQLWGKAEDFLKRALGGAPAAAWEAMGRLFRDRDDPLRAQQAFENALRAGRGEPVRSLPAHGRTRPELASPEPRNSMGLPLLPAREADDEA